MKKTALWLSSNFVIELQTNKMAIIISPERKERIELGEIPLNLIIEIFNLNIKGRPFVFVSKGETINKIEIVNKFIDLKILLTSKPLEYNEEVIPSFLTLLEMATLKISQVGGCFRSNLPPNYDETRHISRYYKTYNREVKLQHTQPKSVDLWNTIVSRRSSRLNIQNHIDLKQMSQILHYTVRTTKLCRNKYGYYEYRPVASGGGKHPVHVYIHLEQSNEIPVGLYFYNPIKHSLMGLDISQSVLNKIVKSSFISTPFNISVNPTLTIFFIVEPYRTASKYEMSTLSTVYKDVGCIIQQLYLVVNGLGLSGSTFSNCDVALLERHLSADSDTLFSIGGFWVW